MQRVGHLREQFYNADSLTEAIYYAKTTTARGSKTAAESKEAQKPQQIDLLGRH